MPVTMSPLQPTGAPWPTQDWSLGPLPRGVDQTKLAEVLETAFGPSPPPDLGETHALVVVHQGRLALERYDPAHGPDSTCPSWSMAKSMTQALVGLLAGDGRLDIAAPVDAPEWRASGDPRSAITLDDLLRMSSGLKFTEVYEPGQPSDVIEMLWGSGKADVAAFAADLPLQHAPGAFWSYSSGTTNIVSRRVGEAIGGGREGVEAFMRTRLFDPLGMRSATPKFDAAGTFIGSSFCFCTPRDFARFGLLYLRDGQWEGRRLLPDGWVEAARRPTARQAGVEDLAYGAHWWLDMVGPGSFSANGFGGQYTVVIPDLDLVIVRHGLTPTGTATAAQSWLKDLVEVLRGV